MRMSARFGRPDIQREGRRPDSEHRELLGDGGTILTINMERHLWIRIWMEYFSEWRLKYRSGESAR